MLSRLAAYDPELEVFEGEQDLQGEGKSGLLNEMDEMTFASELLEVRGEQELNHFLKTLILQVAKAVGTPVPAPVGHAIVGLIKSALQQVLSGDATRVGSLIGGPFGVTVSGQLASIAGPKLGLELEGLSHEDREFETARQLVRFSSEAVRNAIAALDRNPDAAARAGVLAAARRYMPGLLRRIEPKLSEAHRMLEVNRSNADRYDAGPRRPDDVARVSGRWVRQDQKIIILET